MRNPLNCPNCGAPITAEKCQYCGTVFLDFSAIQVGAPSYVKFKMGDTYIITRMVVTALEITPEYETQEYTDNLGLQIASRIINVGCGIHLDAHAVLGPEEKTLITVIKTGEE